MPTTDKSFVLGLPDEASWASTTRRIDEGFHRLAWRYVKLR
jgi:hypothetical protein